ncbi:MAG: PDZ domain-containing protein, partial [Planctomycetota bacterium]|nr:PDZ domain-containing protein [Planctomycetota bacterium]
MKPHSLRSGLWLANLVLGVAVLGVGAWLMLKVRPAVAKVTDRPANKRPAQWEKVRKEYEGQRLSGLKWKPTAPVSETDIRKVVLRKDFERKKHWIFSGPMPPPDPVETGPVEEGPPPPKGLETLGTISSVIYLGAKDSVILFAFGGKSLAFSVGDFVRKSDQEAARFKLVEVKEIREKVFEIHYEVYDAGSDKPTRTDKMVYNTSDEDEGYPGFLRPEGKKAGGSSSGVGSGKTDPAGDGTAKAAPKDGEKDPAKDAAKKGPQVVDVAGVSADNLTLQDLKPEIEYNPRNRNQRAIKFDNNSYRYFRGKNAKNIAESVKTKIAKDANGRTIGLRLTGFGKDAPADVFNVRRGDILVSINGQKVTSRADAIRLAERLSPEKIVTVVIDRNGKLVTY